METAEKDLHLLGSLQIASSFCHHNPLLKDGLSF
jgi:hypothetical protein